MDDYDINSLIESKNEWCVRLVNIFTPEIIHGLKSIFTEAQTLCSENDEDSKYLMTFQNLLINIPKWSSAIIEKERERIITSSNCNYIDDLISCVHIIQLKALTATRVGIKQKKINIEIPNIDKFIHKLYINVARKVYLNIYLFETDIPALNIQKNNRELEIIIKEVILNTIRDNIPVENILKAYLDETEETDTVVEEKKETIVDQDAVEQQRFLLEQERKSQVNNMTDNMSDTVNSLKIEDLEPTERSTFSSTDKLSLGDIIQNDSSAELSAELSTEPSRESLNLGGLIENNTRSNDTVLSNDTVTNDTIVSNNMAVKPTDDNSIKIDTEELKDDNISLEIQDLNTVGIEPEIDLGIEEL